MPLSLARAPGSPALFPATTYILLGIGVVAIILFASPIVGLVEQPLSSMWARVSCHVLGQAGISVLSYDNRIIVPQSTLVIDARTSGVHLLGVSLCALLAVPMAWKTRAIWLVPVVTIWAAVVLLRILSTVLVHMHNAILGMFTHAVIWPLVLCVVLGWVIWRATGPSYDYSSRP